MKYYNLHGINASRVAMGCMRIADKPLQETESLIVEAVRNGVNTFDLADIYGKGDCERIFGVAVKDLGLSRKEYLVQTKCGICKSETGRWYDFSAEYILNSVDNSLKRLNTEYIDIFLLHRPDTLMEADEIATAFEKLRANGKVRLFGVANGNLACKRCANRRQSNAILVGAYGARGRGVQREHERRIRRNARGRYARLLPFA